MSGTQQHQNAVRAFNNGPIDETLNHPLARLNLEASMPLHELRSGALDQSEHRSPLELDTETFLHSVSTQTPLAQNVALRTIASLLTSTLPIADFSKTVKYVFATKDSADILKDSLATYAAHMERIWDMGLAYFFPLQVETCETPGFMAMISGARRQTRRRHAGMSFSRAKDESHDATMSRAIEVSCGSVGKRNSLPLHSENFTLYGTSPERHCSE